MLMALLYAQGEQIVAAAPACDQVAHGEKYWSQYHEAELSLDDSFETAIVFIADPDLQSRLLRLGIDESIQSVSLTREVAVGIAPMQAPGKAA